MTHQDSERAISELVAAADRRRRTRAAAARAASLAPLLAGSLVATAALARFAGWSRAWGLAGLVLAAAGLFLYTRLAQRARPTTDAIALQVDTDAGLRGELRSAHWFSTTGTPDEWARFHVDAAASRVERIDWLALYPPVRTGRAWSIAGALAVMVVALSIVLPPRRVAARIDPHSAEELAAAVTEALPGLPPDVQAQLEALMAAMKNGTITAADLKNALDALNAKATLDPALQKKLNELAQMRDAKELANKKAGDAESEAPKGSTEAAGMPEEARWAAEDQAARQASENANRETNGKNQAASEQSGEKGVGAAQAQTAQATAAQASMQMVREAATDANAGKMMMMSGGGQPGGDPRTGAGGRGGQAAAVDVARLTQALRKELVEANSDTLGENVNKDDLRRKTEEGRSSMGFSRAGAPVAFDPSHASAPPPVPESRRSLVQSYFVRKSP